MLAGKFAGETIDRPIPASYRCAQLGPANLPAKDNQAIKRAQR